MKFTKQLLIILVLVVAITCIVAFAPLDAVWIWIRPLPKTVKEQVDNTIDHHLDGIIVYVDKKGRAPELYAAGWKNRENKIPANPQALFKIASISKLYIAVAVTKLVNNKTLLLDKTLADYLPELVGRIEYANEITLRMLLQHRNGIPDFIDDPKLPWSNLPNNSKEFLKLVLDKPADFKPNMRYQYSNTNFLLIGNILDKILGYSHQQYIKKEILDKLAITHTYGSLNEVNINDVVSGYYTKYVGDLKTQNFVCPGGSMVATATVIIMFVNTSGGNTWTTLETAYNRIVKIVHKQTKYN